MIIFNPSNPLSLSKSLNEPFLSLSLSLSSLQILSPLQPIFFYQPQIFFLTPLFLFLTLSNFSSMNIPSSAKIYFLPPQPFFSEPLNYFPPKYPLLLIDGCVLVTFLMTVNALEVDDKIRVEGTSASER